MHATDGYNQEKETITKDRSIEDTSWRNCQGSWRMDTLACFLARWMDDHACRHGPLLAPIYTSWERERERERERGIPAGIRERGRQQAGFGETIVADLAATARKIASWWAYAACYTDRRQTCMHARRIIERSRKKESDMRTCTQLACIRLYDIYRSFDLPPPDRRSMYCTCPCILIGRQTADYYYYYWCHRSINYTRCAMYKASLTKECDRKSKP